VCGDGDADGCDDCSSGTDGFGPLADARPEADGPDADGDGRCAQADSDDDNDGVADGADTDPGNPRLCADSDGDGCDDCVAGVDDLGPLPDARPENDGDDSDGDGLCDAGDPDDDNDGAADTQDPAPLNPDICGDTDADLCDDCAVGADDWGPRPDANPLQDGDDADRDGLCNHGDLDDDGDSVVDEDDSAPLNAGLCADGDRDGCEDCSLSRRRDPAHDGPDADSDGVCDAGDSDDDNDGAGDSMDSAPQDPRQCRDRDRDGCDDCSVGTDGFGPQPDVRPNADGEDLDLDGLCDRGDPDDDNDGIPDADDVAAQDPLRCIDADGDACDDCHVGTDGLGPARDADPRGDGPDVDRDGLCDAGDADDDNDGVPDSADAVPLDPALCGDRDADGCDDCTVGSDRFGPRPDIDASRDGPDADGDGLCDRGDPCPHTAANELDENGACAPASR
jgi:hypothetical protein